jgi:hypothetical protein
VTFADEVAHVAARVGAAGTAMSVEKGLPAFVDMAKERGLFLRATWTRMQLPGATYEEQATALFLRRGPLEQTAIWTDGAYVRVLTREDQRTVFSVFTVGRGPTRAQRNELYRALWDVGVERFYGYMRKDHPFLQTVLRLVPDTQVEPCPLDEQSVTLIYPVDAKQARP